MNINATLVGQIIFVFAIIAIVMGYYLGKRKTDTPGLTALIAGFTALLPPLAIVFLVLLILKKDIVQRQNEQG